MEDNLKMLQNEVIAANKITPCRVAAYCRVSTRLEEQEGSYDLQVSHYRDKINKDPNMELVGIFGDRGKSGLRVRGRDGLIELLELCEKGKVDMIITKSISRLSRSMADSIEIIRKLRAMKVTIYFEKENLYSTDLKFDLILNILAALAEEESNSISQNMIRAHEQYASEGRPFGNVPYGYCSSEGNNWKINENEAKRIQLAFEMAYEKKSYPDIRKALDTMEQAENTRFKWKQKKLHTLLKNRVYLGEYLSHQHIRITPGHEVCNKGYRDQYLIEDHHKALVSQNVFDQVQEYIDQGLLVV